MQLVKQLCHNTVYQMEFCSLPGMACDIFAIFLHCKFLNSSTCTKQSRHKMWVKTLRMDCSPWIDKKKSFCWTCQSLWMLIASYVHPLQAQLCPPVCSSAHTSNYTFCKTSVQSNGWIWSFEPSHQRIQSLWRNWNKCQNWETTSDAFIWGPWCWRPPDSTPSMFPPR